MDYGFELFEKLCCVVEEKPQKFFCNEVAYKGRNMVVFDYGMTTPNDFGIDTAFDTRGTCFEVDDHGCFVELVALPFEKFFNLHEYDYQNNDDLKKVFRERYGIECDSATVMDIVNDEDTIVMDKRDGSIITYFMFDGELDAKSNTSLTSDYKYEALELLRNEQPELYSRIKKVCESGYSVSTEYTSKNPFRQIVLPYTENRITVTGVRSHKDGSYASYEWLTESFGNDNVVGLIEHDIGLHSYSEEEIEGYVVWHQPTGLRFKMKTEWYIKRHRVTGDVLTPSKVWALFINEEIDDIGAFVSPSAEDVFNKFIEYSEELYTAIVEKGIAIYEGNRHLKPQQFFPTITVDDERHRLSLAIAKNLYNGMALSDAIEKVKEGMLIRKNIQRMGVTSWGDYV